jgi:hypothetical protein
MSRRPTPLWHLELLESAETDEEPFQALLTRYPALLSATVVGGWRTFVIPKTPGAIRAARIDRNRAHQPA